MRGHYFQDTEFMTLFNNINPELVQPNKPRPKIKKVADGDVLLLIKKYL